jgi:nucleoporin NDC1
LLTVSALAIIILRISQYHVGIRASASPFLSAASNVFTIEFLEAWIFYGFSSSLFCLVYTWSTPDSADLRWIKVTSGDRARLNQKPVFIAFYLAVSAASQAFLHMACDEDKIQINANKAKGGSKQGSASSPPSSINIVAARLPVVAMESFIKASIAWLLSYTLYLVVFQQPVWTCTMFLFRIIYNLPKTNMVPGDSVLKLALVMHCIWAGFLLSIVWAIGNYAFSLFMVKEPLKNGKPLSSDSKDPNGSLLNGLKSKKMPIRVSQPDTPLACIC